MIPGGLLLALIRVLKVTLPQPWPALLSGPDSWKSVVVPLAFATGAYLIGAAMDGIFRRLGLAEKFGRSQYETALRENKETRPVPRKASEERFQFDAWQWLALGQSNTTAFSLAHRFQAESRLFALSAAPAAALIGLSVSERLSVPCSPWIGSAVGIVVLVIFGVCAVNSEKNRWIWTLAAICPN
jgi:hypothetical protein